MQLLSSSRSTSPVPAPTLAAASDSRRPDASLHALRCSQGDGASPDACDSAGNPALVVSARVRALECVLALLDAGAKVSATNVELETALHVAAEAGDVAVAECLMAADADGKLSSMRDARGRLARDLFPEQTSTLAQHSFAVVSGWGRAVLSKGRAISALEAATGGKGVASNTEAANALGLLGVPLASSEGAAAMVEGASISDGPGPGGRGEEGAAWDREAFAAAVENLTDEDGWEHPTSPAASSSAGCSPRANGAAGAAAAHAGQATPAATLQRQVDEGAAAAASTLAQASSDTEAEDGKAPAGMVFLGGACGSTTWRAETAVPKLTAAGIPFFNPQLGEGEWDEAAVEREAVAKQAAGTLLFVFTSCTRAVSSCIEAAEFATVAAHTAQDVVLVIQNIEAGTTIEGDVSRAGLLPNWPPARRCEIALWLERSSPCAMLQRPRSPSQPPCTSHRAALCVLTVPAGRVAVGGERPDARPHLPARRGPPARRARLRHGSRRALLHRRQVRGARPVTLRPPSAARACRFCRACLSAVPRRASLRV